MRVFDKTAKTANTSAVRKLCACFVCAMVTPHHQCVNLSCWLFAVAWSGKQQHLGSPYQLLCPWDCLHPQLGGGPFLYCLLYHVVQWAARTDVPVKDAAWRQAQRVLDDGMSTPGLLTHAGEAVVALFAGFQVPVLVLLGRCAAAWPAAGKMGAGGRAYLCGWCLPHCASNAPKRAGGALAPGCINCWMTSACMGRLSFAAVQTSPAVPPSHRVPTCLRMHACTYADHLQGLLQPTVGADKLDEPGAIYIRDHVLREILAGSPAHVLWAFSGGSMALPWMALEAMPAVGGTAPLKHILPVSADAWRQRHT